MYKTAAPLCPYQKKRKTTSPKKGCVLRYHIRSSEIIFGLPGWLRRQSNMLRYSSLETSQGLLRGLRPDALEIALAIVSEQINCNAQTLSQEMRHGALKRFSGCSSRADQLYRPRLVAKNGT